MPRLIRLYILNVAIGFVLAVIFTALLIGFDVANLRHLVFADPLGWVAALMLVVFHTVLFGGVQFAIVIMGMADRSGGGRGRRIAMRGPSAAPQAARAIRRGSIIRD